MARPVLPPEAVVLIDLLGKLGRPPGTAEKPFYDWMANIHRAVASGGGIAGVTDGSDPAPGQVGEIIESNRLPSSPVFCSSGGINDITTITLTPGDWRVTFSGKLQLTPGTNCGGAIMSISAASGTLGSSSEARYSYLTVPDAGLIGAGAFGIASLFVGPFRMSLGASTIIYSNVLPIFTGSVRAYGNLQAERRR